MDDSLDIDVTLEGADPELCITLFKREFNFAGLKQRMLSADRPWMEEFLESGGLAVIFDSLRGGRLERQDTAALDCVECVKVAMNNRFGLEFAIQRSQGFAHKLAQVLALDTANNGLVKLKMRVFELLSALCVYSTEGHNTALDVLEDYKRTKGQSYQFSLLTEELRAAETQDYTYCILALVNCILAKCDSLSRRVKLRNEFIALELPDILAPQRQDVEEPLAIQMELFKEWQEEDIGELDMPGAVNMDSHEDVCNAIFGKVHSTANKTSFLNILQCLFQIEQGSEQAAVIWGFLEQLTQLTVSMDSPSQAEETMQTLKAGMEKIRLALQEKPKSKQQASAAPLLPPPPPPSGGPLPPPPPPPPPPSGGPLPPPPPPPPPNGGPLPPPPPPPPPNGSLSPSLPPAPIKTFVEARNHKPRETMKKVNWAPVPKDKAGGLWNVTVIDEAVDAPTPTLEDVDGPITIDPEMVEKLFSFPKQRVKEKKKPEEEKTSLLDLDTESRVVIHLRQFRRPLEGSETSFKTEAIPNEEVVGMIAKGDISAMTREQVKALDGLLPAEITVENLMKEAMDIILNGLLPGKIPKKEVESHRAKIVAKILHGDVTKMSRDDVKALLPRQITEEATSKKLEEVVDMIHKADIPAMSREALRLHQVLAEEVESHGASKPPKALSTAEDLLFRMIQVEEYHLRIEFMQVQGSFAEMLGVLKPNINKLRKAISEVMTCNTLKRVFYTALNAGNIINGGDKKLGSAYGFSVNSLELLKDTKSKKAKEDKEAGKEEDIQSLLHYLAKLCEDDDPQLLEVQSQLPHLEHASKLKYDVLKGQVADMKKKLVDLEKTTEKRAKDVPDDLKEQLKTFLKESHKTVDELSASLVEVKKESNSLADYFCEEQEEFEPHILLSDLFEFIKEFQKAAEDNHQREEERKRREARKALFSKKKRVAADSAEEDTDSEDDIDIIDHLLQEIKVGDILRPANRNHVPSKLPTEEGSGEGAEGADEKAGTEATDSDTSSWRCTLV